MSALIHHQLTKADKAWLKKNRARLHRYDEEWDGYNAIWFQVVRGKVSLSGHPLPTVREAINAAKARKEAQP